MKLSYQGRIKISVEKITKKSSVQKKLYSISFPILELKCKNKKSLSGGALTKKNTRYRESDRESNSIVNKT